MAETTTKGVKAKPATETTPAQPAIVPVKNFAKNFKEFIHSKSITLNKPICGKTTFSLEEKKEVMEKKEKVQTKPDNLLGGLQTNIDKIFGDDNVKASIVLNPKNPHGNVLLTPNDGFELSDKLTGKLEGKFEKGEDGKSFKSIPGPLPTSKLLEGVAREKDAQGRQ
jgi:hypothetical protein